MAALGAAAVAAVGAVIVVGWVVAVADSAPNLSELSPRQPQPPTRIFAADGTLLGAVRSDVAFSRVSPKQIPNTLKQATVAIEDRRFWHHGALDYLGIVRAGIADVFGSHRSVQGASTLTMQLVDNMYMPRRYSAHRNIRYKIVQAKLAEQLESRHSKAWILDQYLNDVPYGTVDGETAVGAGAASQMFFGKPLWELSLAQQAMLAGLPQAPTTYNPFLRPDLALRRRADVLRAMVDSHYISRQQATAAEHTELDARRTTVYTRPTQPYAFDYAVSQLIQRYGLKTVEDGGLRVYTTIDPRMEQLARDAIVAHQPGGPVLTAQPAAGLASIDPSNGHVLALGSSSTYDQTSYDYPVQAHRQPGSSFKVFALMTLIHDYAGDPGRTYYTSQFLPPGWLPENPGWSVHTAEETYQGTISVTDATTVSDNTVFAQLGVDLGPAKIDATAHAMGITSALQGFPAEVIGGLRVGVTPLEMADAYATLANGGYHVPPTIIGHVVFPDGSTDSSLGNPPRHQVFSYGEVYAAINVLKSVITSGTGTAAGFGCPAAGKTGTAESLANAWFVGFTPRLSTAVWVGYPQANIGMADGFGGVLAAPIWHDFMSGASNGYCGDWPAPAAPFNGAPYLGAHATAGGPTIHMGANRPAKAAKPAPQKKKPPRPTHAPHPQSGSHGSGTSTRPPASSKGPTPKPPPPATRPGGKATGGAPAAP